jgi:group II intron reverse transcriptase/maturase
VIELDIQNFFDAVDHGHLRSFLDQRVRDGVVRRAIDKWLKAGVMEQGAVRHPDTGTPQGGVVSPILANIYLHEVFDWWFESEVKPRLSSTAFAVRYADDAVLVFANEADARRVMAALPKRFGKYGLKLHPDKTRIVDFRSPPRRGGRGDASRRHDEPRAFELLGFKHFWRLSYKGNWAVRRKTASSRLGRVLKRLSQWCRQHRHDDVREQHRMLVLKMRGHYSYYGITGNGHSLYSFWWAVHGIWRRWLDRRSQKAKMYWTKYRLLMQRYRLPRPVTVHSLFRPVAKP